MPTIDINYQLQQGTGKTGEPVRKNSWEVEIPEILGSIPLYAQSFTCPESSVERMEVRHFNGVAYLAGKPSVAEGTLQCRDVLEPDMFTAMINWYKSVYNMENAELGYASEYKKRGLATRYDSKGNKVRTYTLVGLWPTKVGNGEWDYESYDGNLIEVTLSCDAFTVA